VTVFRATPATARVFGLAEGPVWDAQRERVIWVDVNAGTVHLGRLSDDTVTEEGQIALGGTVGAVVTSRRGELLVAGTRHLHIVALDGSVTRWIELVPDGKASRLNDGGCDPSGRFLVGSMALDGRVHDESLARIESTGRITVIDDDLSLSNGLAFSADGGRLYSVDTAAGTVWRRSHDRSTGQFGPRSEFLRIVNGSPDGLCLDFEGNLWVAIWGAGEVRCFTPSGAHIATVEVAAPHTSSVAFVGPGLDTLLITTASEQLSAADLARYPDSGRLFTARVGVTGLPVPYWAGP
jgi:sugar lactone lactonase YvrE